MDRTGNCARTAGIEVGCDGGMKLAILPWGNVIEDFLGPIGLTVEQFATRMSGGWLFGYAEALHRGGIESCVIVFSASLRYPARFVNPETGRVTVALPAAATYRAARHVFGDVDGQARGAIPVRALGRIASFLATPAAPLVAALHAEACSAVLCQEYEYARFASLARIAGREGLGLFATFQGGSPSAGAFERRLRDRAIAQAAGLIVGSKVEQERLAATCAIAADRIAAIVNPLDLDEWRAFDRTAARERLGIPADARVAIWHGRVDYRRKGLDLLLEAWRLVTGNAPGADLRLHLIGSGADDAVLRREIAAACLPGIRWLDRYSNDRNAMRLELSAADLYVLPSRHEGFPVAPMEAMACGLPAVMTDVPGARDIVPYGDASGGVIVPPDNPEALATAMLDLLDDPRRRKAMGAAARSRIGSFASLDATGEMLATFLRSRSGARPQASTRSHDRV